MAIIEKRPSAKRTATKKTVSSAPRSKVGTKKTSKTPGAASTKPAAKKGGSPKGARADVAFVKARLGRVKTHFYDIGEALARLAEPAALQELGHANLSTLVKKELKMSTQLADRLVSIATHVSRDLAVQVGQRHAWALVRLTRPTSLTDPYPTGKRKTLALPTGDQLKIPTAAARAAMADAAATTKAERARRGRTTTAVERHVGAEIDACLKALGIDKARVRTVATRPGQVANLRIELPLSDIEAVCKVLCPK